MDKHLKQEKTDCLRIVLFGPESTGKTTLASALAKIYNTVWVEEYAREYLQEKWNDAAIICEKEDIIPIAIGQIKIENQAIPLAKKIIFTDTNILETKIYAEQYYENYKNTILDTAIENSNYDFYFLTDIDTPYEQDDLRDRPHMRQEMFDAFKEGLERHQCRYQKLSGTLEQRIETAKKTIDKLLENG